MLLALFPCLVMYSITSPSNPVFYMIFLNDSQHLYIYIQVIKLCLKYLWTNKHKSVVHASNIKLICRVTRLLSLRVWCRRVGVNYSYTVGKHCWDNLTSVVLQITWSLFTCYYRTGICSQGMSHYANCLQQVRNTPHQTYSKSTD